MKIVCAVVALCLTLLSAACQPRGGTREDASRRAAKEATRTAVESAEQNASQSATAAESKK